MIVLDNQGRVLLQTGAESTGGLFSVEICDRVNDPGLGHDTPAWVDYSRLPISTPDQQRIESVLDGMELKGRALLHVGVGNSLLARRFASRCTSIDGITISPAEEAHARTLDLPNYRTMRVNKYSAGLPAALERTYDVIIDNNLASFACCGFHLLVMFNSYRHMLRAGGMILTDQQGMNWVVGDARFRLLFADLTRIAQRFHMIARRINEYVMALVRE